MATCQFNLPSLAIALKKAVRLADRRWRKAIHSVDGNIDRKLLEVFLILELKNRLAAGEVWVKGSRAYPPKALADEFDARLPEIRRFLSGKLDTERTEELGAMMRKAGLPI